MVVGAGTGVFVVGEGHDVTLVLRLALTWVRIGAGFGSGVSLANGGRRRQLHIRARIDPHMRRVMFVRAFMPPVCPPSRG